MDYQANGDSGNPNSVFGIIVSQSWIVINQAKNSILKWK